MSQESISMSFRQIMMDIGKFMLIAFLCVSKYLVMIVAHFALGAISPTAGQGSAYAVQKYFDDLIDDIEKKNC